MEKKRQEKLDLQRKQEDQALNRASLWVIGAVVLEMLIFFVNRYYINFKLDLESIELAETISNTLRYARLVGLAVLVAGLVWTGWNVKKQRGTSLSVAVSAAGVALFGCSQITLKFQDAGVRMLFLLVPVWAAVALIYYLYQKEFFVSGIACVLSAMGIWFVRACNGMALEVIVCLIGILAVLAVVCLLKKNNGALAGKQILPEDTNYLLVLGTGAAALAMPLIAMVIGNILAYYLIFVVAGWMFALLVYYTVKMM